MRKKNYLLLLFLIIILGAFLRLYRISELAVFLADQASDSQKVLDMLRGKFTLLGPITSVGGFYNGPIVYYLMFPFYFLFKGDPIAGTIFQSTLSVLTIPLLYLLGKKIKNEEVGLLAGFLLAISPLMIDYARATFNAYPAIFFSTLIIYLFFIVLERYNNLIALLLGIMIGWIIQMHYLAIVFLFLVILYPSISKKNRFPFSYYCFVLAGFVLGIFPFLLFEIRHQFLNTQLFFKYLAIKKSEKINPIYNTLYIWPYVTGWLLFGKQLVLGMVGFVIIAASTINSFIKKQTKPLSVFIFLFVLVFLTGFVYGRTMHDHYLISFHTSLIFLFALMVINLFKKKDFFIIATCLILAAINFNSWNLTKEKHPLQNGLNMADFKKSASIIKKDGDGVYNVAMHAQGDNRAIPLRYMLSWIGEKPLDYEHYGEAQTLYFIIPKNEKLEQQTMWEYKSFGSSKVIKKWDITKSYFMYKLCK